MRIAVFSAKPHDRRSLTAVNDEAGAPHDLAFFDTRLTAQTAGLVEGQTAVAVFVNDEIGADTLEQLATRGIVGTGTIGTVFARLMRGFHCEVLAYDPFPNDEITRMRGIYVGLDELFERSHMVSLHCPLTSETHHLLDDDRFGLLPAGALVVNTSRGGLIDTTAAVRALKSGHLGGLAIDVYEEEADLFFEDRSEQILTDDVFARLLSFPNVLITSHQAFFTHEGLRNIAQTTLDNATAFQTGEGELHRVK